MKKTMLLLLLTLFISMALFSFQQKENSMELLSSKSNESIVTFTLSDYSLLEVTTPNGIEHVVSGKNLSGIIEKGAPDLPKAVRSFIIPDFANMQVEVLAKHFTELHNVNIAPSKGYLMRTQDPDSVPYEYGKRYSEDAFFPADITHLNEPYIIRDFRGQALDIYPIQYNPVTKVLRVYTEITLRFYESDGTGTNVFYRNRQLSHINREFHNIYARQFINYNELHRYTPLEEEGSMLIIAHDAYMEPMYPFIEWKNTIGLHTEMVGTSVTGTTWQNIKAYIQNYYDNPDNNLIYVLFVGDAQHIPPVPASGTSVVEGYSDNFYGYLVGTDRYQEIFVGRFSAESLGDVATQVQRNIEYEQAYNFADGWLNVAMGVARREGAGAGHNGEADDQHMELIRQKLLTYNYATVHQDYDGNSTYCPNTTAAQISSRINAGVSLINFCNHGSQTGWSVANYSISHVNALANTGKLPFIWSVACVNGQFQGATCFAEAWVRATHNGQPSGALAFFGATINQPWTPPQDAQDEFNDILIGSYANNIKRTYGGISINGVFKMLDLNNNSSGWRTAETWTIFGDPSVKIRTDNATPIAAVHDPIIMFGFEYFTVNVDAPGAYASLSNNGVIVSTATESNGVINIPVSEGIQVGDELTLAITAYNKIPYIAQVDVTPAEGPYVTIDAVTVQAGDDSIIEFGETVTLSVNLKNVGVETAPNVIMTITTDNPYVTIIDASESAGTIQPDQVVALNNAFQFSVANNIPNNHQIHFAVEIVSPGFLWENNIFLTAFAPVLTISNVLVLDDDNNMLDPGDRAFINVTVQNSGGAKAHNLSALLSTDSNLISFNQNTDTAAMIAAGGNVTFTFDVDVSETAEISDSAQFTLNVTADNEYAINENFTLTIGLIIEDFESGDFTQKPWEFSGNLPWVISNEAYEGDYAAKSGAISHSQSSGILIELLVTQDDEIRFWRKVSSEASYDFLKFYINDQEVGSWSGDVAWSEVAFPVSAGDTIFRWTYSKDGSVSSGSDCAWIDNIIFPPSIVPQPANLVVEISEIYLEMVPNLMDTYDFTLQNTGDLPLYYSIGIQNTTEEGRDLTGTTVSCNAEGFTPGETVTWTFSVNCVSIDNEWIKDLWIEFPTGVTVNSSTNLVGGSGGAIPTGNQTGDGVTLHWTGAGYIANGQTATADVVVTIGSGFVGDISLPWIIEGDGWGSPPHTIEGVMSIQSLGEPLTWMAIEQISGTLGRHESHQIEIVFDTNDMDYGTYTANIIIQHSAGEDIIIPVTLVVTDTNHGDISLPSVTALVGNYPNPFNPTTTIKFATQESGHVAIDIFNVKGQRVRTLVDEHKSAGYHTVEWNGKDNNGRNVGSGIYFSNMRAGKYTATRKLILMK